MSKADRKCEREKLWQNTSRVSAIFTVKTKSGPAKGVDHLVQGKASEPDDRFEKGTMPKSRRLRVIIQAFTETPNREANPYPKLCVLRDPRDD